VTLYKSCHDGGSQPSIDALHNTLLHLLGSFRHVYIIIDSLDECKERKELLDWIEEIISWREHKLHILVTSRNEESIAERLRLLELSHVYMDPTFVNNDIKQYIDSVLQTDKQFKRWDQDIQRNIRVKLIERAGGMYDFFRVNFVTIGAHLVPQVSIGLITNDGTAGML